MSRRVRSETLKRFALASALTLVPIGILIFTYLSNLGVIAVESYSANEHCGGDITCYLELNKTCFKEDVFVYPMQGGELINASPPDNIIDFKMMRKWGAYWRAIDLNTTCKSTACGGLKGVTNNAYSYAFRKGKCYDLRIEVKKVPEAKVHWEINPEGDWLPCDTKIVYESLSVTEKVIDKTNIESIAEKCVFNLSINKDTCVPAHDKVSYTYKNIVTYYNGKQIGVEVNCKLIDNANIKDGYLVEWSVPIGNRNFDEYGRCREYEKDKGVCFEVEIK